ncbi:MAG: flagellar assembly protein FliW [Christensenellales bacterium]|jgi:flagellar assembly factor FliW
MTIETRFGTAETSDNKIITFPRGLPGFEDLRQFIIVEVDNTKPIYWLQSIENKHIALPVIVSLAIINDYNINIRERELEDLELESQDDLLILNVVVIPTDIREMTVNLAAPVVINAKRGIGKQIIIDAAELPLRYPVFEAIRNSLKGGEKDAGSLSENG